MRSGLSFMSMAASIRGDGGIAYPNGLAPRYLAAIVEVMRTIRGMIMKSNLNVHHVITKTKVFRRLGWLIAGGALVLILLIFFSSAVDPRCAPLLAHSDEVVVPLPPNCTQTSVRPTGEMTNNLERERNQRDLILKSWIICKPSNSPPEISLLLDQDPRWLPSYVPGTYQF